MPRTFRLLLELLVLVALVVSLFWTTLQLHGGNMKLIYPVRLLLLVVTMLAVLRAFAKFVLKGSMKEGRKKLCAALTMIGVLLILVEAVFMFVPRIHSTTVPHSARIWLGYYWNPINSLGFRDAEPQEEKGKKRLVFIGDSFVAGHGIKRVKDRFSDRIAERLGNDYCVNNLGVSGTNSIQQWKNLINFPHDADLAVLCYFGNDIEGLVPSVVNFKLYADLPAFLRPVVRGSFLLDYIYWGLPHPYFNKYKGNLMDGYADPAVMKEHGDFLIKFKEHMDAKGGKMAVLMMPFLYSMDQSEAYIKPVGDVFRNMGVPVLDLRDALRQYEPSELVVNSYDQHAGVFGNEVIANATWDFLIKEGLIDAAE